MKAARQQTIVDLLSQHKSLTTEALAVQLNVSKETIRRDLSELQDRAGKPGQWRSLSYSPEEPLRAQSRYCPKGAELD